MFISRLFSRYLPIMALILVLVASAFAFAAGNSVPESGAGDGSGTISGYTVTNIDYTLNADPTLIDTVEFDIAPTAGANNPDVVSVQLNGGAWFSCAVAAGHATCDVSSGAITVLSANDLRVVAAE
jgi:hypothetical protein